MSTIYISTGDGQTMAYDESQARAMHEDGRLPAGTIYWKEGMAEWQPLKSLFAPVNPYLPPSIPAAPAATAPGRFVFTKDPTGLTRTLKVLMWIQLGVAMLSMLSDIAQLRLLGSAEINPEAAQANDLRQGAVGLLHLGMVVATGITFLMWIHRANRNCHGFGAQGMRFTPGWSVGCYFIPLLNLVRPYQAMKEIWLTSSDPLGWRPTTSTPLVGWWWTFWIISSVLGNIVFRINLNAETPEALITGTQASIISALIDIPLSLLAITLVTRICHMQTRLVSGQA